MSPPSSSSLLYLGLDVSMQAASVLPLTTMGVESGTLRRNATKGVDVSGLWISKERDHVQAT